MSPEVGNLKVYRCRALLDGKGVERRVRAPDRDKAVELCEREGLLPLEVEEVRERKIALPFRRGYSLSDISLLLSRIHLLLKAGTPLVRALEILASQSDSDRLAAALLQIKRDIERGENVGEAFAKSGIFPTFLSEMLRSAQTAEHLETVFKIAAEHLERVETVKREVLTAVAYPAVVMALSFVAVIVAVVFVLPRMEEVLTSFGKSLPLITRLVVFGVKLSLLVPPLLLLLYLLLRRRYADKPEEWGRLLLKLPFAGKILLYTDLARFSAVAAMLLKTALPLNNVLKLAVGALGNAYLKGIFQRAAGEVERGRSLSSVLRKEEVFPKAFVDLVETGEESGELETAFETLAELYESETRRTISFWLTLVEPLTVLLIALVVGIIVLSVMLPLAEISTGAFVK